MASVNPLKVFNFAIEIDGIDVLLIQEVKEPEIEIGAVKHGNGNHDEKTAGGVAVSDAELKKLVSASPLDDDIWAWLFDAQDISKNTGGLEEDYKRDIVFKHLSPKGTVKRAFLWEGAWVRKIASSNWQKGEKSENVIETATISVDRVVPVSV